MANMRIDKKALLLSALLLLPLAVGCGCEKAASASPPPLPAAEKAAVAADPADGETPLRVGAYLCDGEQILLEGGRHEATRPDENAVLCVGGGELTINQSDIVKSGDAAEAETAKKTGVNAAVCAAESGSVVLKNCTVLSEGAYAAGIHAAGVQAVGTGASVAVEGGSVATSGDGSPALAAVEGGGVTVEKADISANGLDAEAVYAEAGGSVTVHAGSVRVNSSPLALLHPGGGVSFTGCDITAATGLRYTAGEGEDASGAATFSSSAIALADGKALTMEAGIFYLTLSEQTLLGNISIGDGELSLILKNGSAFTGQITAEDFRNISVSLDENSVWTLTGESSVGVIQNANADFSNIVGNGNTLHYDSSLAGNEALGGRTFALKDGGYLVPMI